MAWFQVADGEDGLQIQRIAGNVLNKQSQIANKTAKLENHTITLWTYCIIH
jgi:hypothetical protein